MLQYRRRKITSPLLLPSLSNNNNNKQTISFSSSSTNAAALQDHYIRNLGLGKTRATYVSTRKQPSLAQKMGLIARDDSEINENKLTEIEWDSIRMKVKDRDGYEEGCPICHEEFKISPHLILSCSHVFHINCFKSFEKFVGERREAECCDKIRICCPVCRNDKYEKKLISDGFEYYKIKVVIKIQSVWRGYRARLFAKTIPPRNPTKRLNFFADKLKKTSDKLISKLNADHNALDYFLNQVDKSVEKSREIMNSTSNLQISVEIDWDKILQRAQTRNNKSGNDRSNDNYNSKEEEEEEEGQDQCAICCCKMQIVSSNNNNCNRNLNSNSRTNNNKKPLTLLSCSHLFHTDCINSCEKYCINDSELASTSCPLCRSNYIRKDLL